MAQSSIRNLNIDGNLVISGSTTQLDVNTVVVADNNITINDIATPTDANANQGGLTLKGTTDKTINWVDANDAWTLSEHLDIATTKEYRINNVSVLNATTLGSAVVNSSLISIGALTELTVDNIKIDGSNIGLLTDLNLITLANDTITVAGAVHATTFHGNGNALTNLNIASFVAPGSNSDIIINSSGALGSITTVPLAQGGTGGTNAATARTNLGVTATGADTAYNFRANNLSDVANVATTRTNLGVTATGADTAYAFRANNLSDVASAATARTNLGVTATGADTAYAFRANNLSDIASVSLSRTNLGLGTANSPKFGGVGTGSVTIIATPSAGPVAPTFSGVVFKSVPVASGSGHKWAIGNEQDGDLIFSYFTINDAGANTSSSESFILFDPTGTKFVAVGSASIRVFLSGLGYPTADGTANQVLTTDGAGTLSFTSVSGIGALMASNNLSDVASVATSRTNLGVTATGADTAYAFRANNLSDLANFATARSNLGLGTIATQAANAVDIDGGAIDGATIGANSAQPATVTTFTSTGIDDNASSTAMTIASNQDTTFAQGIKVGNIAGAAGAGNIRWSGTDFQGHDGTEWVSLTSAATAQISGNIAIFNTSPTITSTTYVDVAGYTTAITVTNSNIINVQVAMPMGNASGSIISLKVVRVVGGTPTDLYEELNLQAGLFNVAYADAHGQSNGTVITYKIMAKVDSASHQINPDAGNAQIFVYEITTSPTSVTSVWGLTGDVTSADWGSVA